MSDRDDLSHVAFPRACDMQQTGTSGATDGATPVQQTSLKALADKVLARNSACNKGATNGQKSVRQTALKTPLFVASVAEPVAPFSEGSAAQPGPDPEVMTENAIEYFEERAAIGEFDGGLSRDEAEQQAAERIFEYKLTGWDQWAVWLGQPGDGLDMAKQWMAERFGEKLVDVRQYEPPPPGGKNECH